MATATKAIVLDETLQQTNAILGNIAVSLGGAIFNNAGAHNSVFRGKSLGNSVTADQWSAILAGTFEDLYVGDYWTIPTSVTVNGTTTTSDINYRIGGFDYVLNCGDTPTTDHSIVIVPDTALYDAKMNDSNTTSGGYIGSKMYTTYLTPAKDAIKAAFGAAHILSHRLMLVNAINGSGYPSGVAWANSDIELMNEQMAYGGFIFSPISAGGSAANLRVEKSQLPLFVHEPSRIVNGNHWWLRDISSSAYFTRVTADGCAGVANASFSFGVRPYFCIYQAA